MTSLASDQITLNFTTSPENLTIKFTLVKECHEWEEVISVIEQNKKTHPNDKIWIFNNGLFQVMREAL
jgi:hypothetical protein